MAGHAEHVRNAEVAKFSYVPPLMKNFVLTEKLGQGSYATVYKAFRKGNLRDVVAIKCIKKSSLSKKSTENLVREIEILKSLNHEHIVKLKDFEWDNEHIFLILEYCSGGDLSSYIKTYKRLPEHTTRKFLRQLALALRYIREKNISHMDLKPHNLFIESKNNFSLKVGDFGFAQYLLGKEGHDNLRGSPLYMAVEMFCSDYYDASVDLWSTGVILHEALFGYAPFASKTFDELEMKIKSKEPITLPKHPIISSKCKDLIEKLLQRDPKKRITFEEFFSHPFVDLNTAPSQESFVKAVKIVTEAVKLDSEKDYKNALKLYCSALEHFLPAIDYERDTEKKLVIREKVLQYIERAEQLKLTVKEMEKKKIQQTQNLNSFFKNSSDFSNIQIYEDKGDYFENNGEYEQALEEYNKGIEICMSLLSDSTNTNDYRHLIKEKAEKMIERAEEINRYIDLANKEKDLKQNNLCCIQ
ncbi:serine/threonine-protein kinase ULK3 isoform X2 [Hydra vulgaris]|uniref:Serine/threonine-protein kinase ULK3 n=1 Tax=Hydra vulgaris TaxID=6087 RepID=A0ABM4B6N3_HYDVU